MYGYDLSTLLSKMVADMADSQEQSGLVPDIVPEYVKFEGGFRDSPEWGSVVMCWCLGIATSGTATWTSCVGIMRERGVTWNIWVQAKTTSSPTD